MLKRRWIQRLVGLALAAVVTASPAFAEEVSASAAHADQGAADQPRHKTYSWQDLLTLVPDLEQAEWVLSTPSQEADEATQVPMVCEREPEIGTRLATRQCYTFEQYVNKKCTLGLRTFRGPHWCEHFTSLSN